MRRDILDYHRSGPNSHSLSNRDQLSHGGPATNVRAGSNCYCAGKDSAARDVSVVPDLAIMLHYRAAVDNDIATERRACIYDATRQQLAPCADICPLGAERGWMLDCQGLQAGSNPMLKESSPRLIIAHCSHTHYEKPCSFRDEFGQQGIIAENWNVQHLLTPARVVAVKNHQR